MPSVRLGSNLTPEINLSATAQFDLLPPSRRLQQLESAADKNNVFGTAKQKENPPLRFQVHTESLVYVETMLSSFVAPHAPFVRARSGIQGLCSRRPPTRRHGCTARQPVHAVASASARDTSMSRMRDESVKYNGTEHVWRKQNATLVTEAKRNGVDAAVEMLWSFSQDGTAVTQNFNQVVSLLASRGRLEDGLELASEAGRRGVANIITFRPLMKWCCSNGDGRGAKRVWKTMNQYSIDGDMFLYAELMGALVRAQDMVSAQKVVTSIHESGRRPHVVLYNTLLKGYAKRADVKRGFEVMKTIEESGIRPDETVCLIDSAVIFEVTER